MLELMVFGFVMVGGVAVAALTVAAATRFIERREQRHRMALEAYERELAEAEYRERIDSARGAADAATADWPPRPAPEWRRRAAADWPPRSRPAQMRQTARPRFSR